MYRELYLIMYLSSAINSAVNFLIYYYRSKDFRRKTKFVFHDIKSIFWFKSSEGIIDGDVLSGHNRTKSQSSDMSI